MPKVFKVLSGKEIVKILESLGFAFISQVGSHMKVSKTKDNFTKVVIVPNHKEVREGTMRTIRKQAGEVIVLDELDKFFKN